MNPFFILLFTGFLISQEASFVKYYKSKDDVIKGIPMDATDRIGKSHIRVFYDKMNNMVSKGWMDETDKLLKEEVFEYNEDGSIWKRGLRTGTGHTEKLYIYGDKEDVSNEFIQYVYSNRNEKEFFDRITVYEFLSDSSIDNYQFFSIDYTPFGTIEYHFSDDKNEKSEKWIRLPEKKLVRQFQYNHYSDTDDYELLEIDSMGTVISHVGLNLSIFSGEELLTLTTSGNVLEESKPIIREIRERKAAGWKMPEDIKIDFQDDSEFLPDKITLNNDETLDVDLVVVTDLYARFRLLGEKEILTIPLVSVSEVKKRDGTVIYPISF